MGGLRIAALALAATLSLSGCAADTNAGPTAAPSPSQTIDPALIPDVAPADATVIDPIIFDSGYGEYTFKVGTGPTWCTINAGEKYVVCEQIETDASYDPLPVPEDCKLSFGYQFKLFENKPKGADAAQITCASGLYADPAGAQTLNAGETLTVGGITCFVVDETARCDNKRGNYIVLGPAVWARG